MVLNLGIKCSDEFECSSVAFCWLFVRVMTGVHWQLVKSWAVVYYFMKFSGAPVFGWFYQSNHAVKQTVFVSDCFLQKQCAAAYFKSYA